MSIIINAKKVLAAAAFYFAACGISAIFFPQSWYWAAGVGDASWNLPLAIVGAMMIGLSVSGVIAMRRLNQARPVVCGFVAANVTDALIVLFYILNESIPLANGVTLLVVDAIWTLCLLFSLQELKEST